MVETVAQASVVLRCDAKRVERDSAADVKLEQALIWLSRGTLGKGRNSELEAESQEADW